jgi:hypothetical protein
MGSCSFLSCPLPQVILFLHPSMTICIKTPKMTIYNYTINAPTNMDCALLCGHSAGQLVAGHDHRQSPGEPTRLGYLPSVLSVSCPQGFCPMPPLCLDKKIIYDVLLGRQRLFNNIPNIRQGGTLVFFCLIVMKVCREFVYTSYFGAGS